MRPGAGLFRIEYRPPACADNITKPNTYMIIEAMRRLEEGEQETEPPPPPAPPKKEPKLPSQLIEEESNDVMERSWGCSVR